MGRQLVAGVDCSTQATKVVVVDVETGEQVASGRATHAVTGTDGARETEPSVWWDALTQALGQTGLAGEIASISVAGQQHGLVCLDAAGKSLRPSMLWNDTRSGPEAETLVSAFGGSPAWASRIGVVPVASFTATKWAWVRDHEPEIADATRAIRLPHDYLTELLTGNGVTDRGDASGTLWWSTDTESYSQQVLDLPQLRLPAELLPQVLGPGQAAGKVTAAAAKATGLPEGALVGPGTGDNMGAALGLGLKPGVPCVSLGTSGTVYLVSTRRAVDPTGTVAGFADASGRFLPLACTMNCTLAVDRMAAVLSLTRDDVAPSNGVVVLPYLDGERTPNLPDASGAVFGLRHETDPKAILMATYEGAMVSLLDALSVIDECSSGADAGSPIVLIGGGAKGTVWRDVVRRLSGRAVSVPEAEEFVAIGGAVQAAAVLTGEAPVDVAQRWATGKGILLDPVKRDDEILSRHRAVRELAIAAITSRAVG